MSPNAGGGKGGGHTGAQINFGDLTPYLTYGAEPVIGQRKRAEYGTYYDDTEQRMYKSTNQGIGQIKRADYTEDANEQRT
jgi:hypothetical protein